MTNKPQRFDPQNPTGNMIKLKGKEYLEVKWRIAWFRHEWPNGHIETSVLALSENAAAIKAEVTQIGESGEVLGRSTGMGQAERNSFESFLEKAETKAVGRALAMLGYGHQFAEPGELDYQQGAHDIESGISRSRPGPGGNQYGHTQAQMSRIQRLANEQGLADEQLADLARQHTGGELANLTKRQASGMIDLLESRIKADVAPAHQSAPDSLTDLQMKEIRNIQARLEWSNERLDGFVKFPLDELTRGNGDRLISDLRRILAEGEQR